MRTINYAWLRSSSVRFALGPSIFLSCSNSRRGRCAALLFRSRIWAVSSFRSPAHGGLVQFCQARTRRLRILFRPACARLRRLYAELRGFVTVFRTCGVGPSARRRGRHRGRLMWSLAVKMPGHSCSTRDSGFKRRSTTPRGDGTAAGALFSWLMHYGLATVV